VRACVALTGGCCSIGVSNGAVSAAGVGGRVGMESRLRRDRDAAAAVADPEVVELPLPAVKGRLVKEPKEREELDVVGRASVVTAREDG
jgi:hypothetical protein